MPSETKNMDITNTAQPLFPDNVSTKSDNLTTGSSKSKEDRSNKLKPQKGIVFGPKTMPGRHVLFGQFLAAEACIQGRSRKPAVLSRAHINNTHLVRRFVLEISVFPNITDLNQVLLTTMSLFPLPPRPKGPPDLAVDTSHPDNHPGLVDPISNTAINNMKEAIDRLHSTFASYHSHCCSVYTLATTKAALEKYTTITNDVHEMRQASQSFDSKPRDTVLSYFASRLDAFVSYLAEPREISSAAFVKGKKLEADGILAWLGGDHSDVDRRVAATISSISNFRPFCLSTIFHADCLFYYENDLDFGLEEETEDHPGYTEKSCPRCEACLFFPTWDESEAGHERCERVGDPFRAMREDGKRELQQELLRIKRSRAGQEELLCIAVVRWSFQEIRNPLTGLAK